MDRISYRRWLEAIDDLSEAWRSEVALILAGRPSEDQVIAALEGRWLADRVCPHCRTRPAMCRGRANGLRRFHCDGCGKSFNALTGTALAGLRHKGRWLDFARSPSESETVRGKAAKRGLSSEQTPILIATDCSGTTVSSILPADTGESIAKVLGPVFSTDALPVTDGAGAFHVCAEVPGITHEVLNQSAGERVRAELHIQTVNSRHERFKTLLRRHRGVATKYLGSYLKWFHLATIRLNPTSRACLNAAMGVPEAGVA